MRKILAILFTLITLFAIKETFYIFTTSDQDIIHKKTQFSIVALSITLPLILFTLWLWSSSKRKSV